MQWKMCWQGISMKVGDLVKYGSFIGVIIEINVNLTLPPVVFHEVFFATHGSSECIHSDNLEVINEKR